MTAEPAPAAPRFPPGANVSSNPDAPGPPWDNAPAATDTAGSDRSSSQALRAHLLDNHHVNAERLGTYADLLSEHRHAHAPAAAQVAAARELLGVLDAITVGRKPQALEDAMDRLRSALGEQP